MKTKKVLFSIFIASLFALIFGGRTYAVAGNTVEISGGKTWNVCVEAGAGYDEAFVVDIEKSGFQSQLVLGGGDCKAVALAAGTYAARLNNVMGAGAASYEIADDTLTFMVADASRNYLNISDSIAYTIEGSGEESPFELLFSMPGECQFNGNANVSGETCKDGDGNPLTDKKYIDTGVALFSEENAGKDFEIYFTLSDYASTQEKQGTLFNAKYENSSMYYPGFTIRTVNTDGGAMEITGRIGNDNTNADKANNGITTADIKNKEVKIVRVGGMVSYSIDGGELIPFQNYENFSRYFEQTAIFGASRTPSNGLQRYFNGTIKNIRVLLKKVGSIAFDANGGAGTMAAIENIPAGTDVALPVNTFTKSGAAFTGWNTEADGSGVNYADEATVTIFTKGALTLYAQWEDILIGSIEFNANGGAGTMASIENIPVGADVSLPANIFTRADHIFNGWNTEADGSGVDYVDKGAVGISSEDTLTLYAQWREPRGSIVFSANGGNGTMAAIENIPLGTNVTLPANTFTMGNGTFTGWNTRVSGSGAFYADEGTVTISSDGKITLYAQWTSISTTTLTVGQGINSKLKKIANDQPIGINDGDKLIKTIEFVDTLPDAIDESTPKVNLANNDSAIPVYAYWVADEGAVYIYSEADRIYAAGASDFMFNGLRSLTSLTLPDYFDTSNVTNMTAMFQGARSLTSLTLPDNFDTSNVTKMGAMFYGMQSLTSLTLPDSFDTSQVEYMRCMFGLMPSLTSLTLPDSFNTSQVTNMYEMFYHLDSLTSLVLPSSFNTSQVTDMAEMFMGMESITSLTLPSGFNTSQVTDMRDMFRSMTSLSSLILPDSFTISNGTDTANIFIYTANTARLYAADIKTRSLWPGVLGN